MAHDVFISYSSKDKTTADATCATLEAKGIRCWIAPRDIRPGADWGEAIIDAINGSKMCVLVFSNNANTSPQISREIERAINKGIPVIPFRIENVMPAKSLEYFLSTPHWLDAFSPPLEKHLDYLAAVSRSVLDGVPAPTPVPVPVIDRRIIIGAGVGALALALAAYSFFPRGGAPSFIGTWTSESMRVEPDMPSPYGTFSINTFYKAALAGNTLAGHFTLDDLGSYNFTWGGEDRGTVSVDSAGHARFVSELTKKETALGYFLLNPAQAASAVTALGGESGDGAIALTAPGSAQSILPGSAQGPGLAGHWAAHTPAMGPLDAASTALDITPDGHYQFHFQFQQTGLFQTGDGTWSRNKPGQPPVTGTFKFDGKNRVTAAGGGGVTIWVRD